MRFEPAGESPAFSASSTLTTICSSLCFSSSTLISQLLLPNSIPHPCPPSHRPSQQPCPRPILRQCVPHTVHLRSVPRSKDLLCQLPTVLSASSSAAFTILLSYLPTTLFTAVALRRFKNLGVS
eukprot:3937224-Rhodomonas_salina.4